MTTSENPEERLPVVVRPNPPKWTTGMSADMASRQMAFYEARVKHPAMNKLVDELMPILLTPSETNIVIVTGATGVGKSTVTRVLLKQLMKDFAGEMERDQSTLPFVAVEAYTNGEQRHSFKGLYEDLCTQLQEPAMASKTPLVETEGRVMLNPQSRFTVAGLRKVVESGLRNRKTRVCVIDEAAHLLRFGKDAAVMDTLKSLANTTNVKWVLVGSFDLFDLVASHGQIARRTAILNLERYRADSADDRNAFKRLVTLLQAKWPCSSIPNFSAISNELLDVSLGCVGLLKSLMVEAAALQIRNNGEWSPQFLQRAAQASKLRKVIQKEIEMGEAKVRDALHGQSMWDDKALEKLALRMGACANA